MMKVIYTLLIRFSLIFPQDKLVERQKSLMLELNIIDIHNILFIVPEVQ